MYFFIAIYIIFWVIISEKVSLESIAVGIVVGFLVFLFNCGFKIKKSQEKISYFSKVKNWTYYITILLKEIVVSNFQVAKIVLSPEIKINPRIVSFETDINSSLNRTILSNSITLTPGTITIGLDGRKLTVHCLDESYVDGVSNTEFEKIIMKVEG